MTPLASAAVLEPAMERRLAKAAEQAKTAVRTRDLLVVEAYKAGGGVREIGRALGMNHNAVRHVLRREKIIE